MSRYIIRGRKFLLSLSGRENGCGRDRRLYWMAGRSLHRQRIDSGHGVGLHKLTCGFIGGFRIQTPNESVPAYIIIYFKSAQNQYKPKSKPPTFLSAYMYTSLRWL